MSDLTITEVKNEKKRLEQALYELIQEFHLKTGATVTALDIEHVEEMSGGVVAHLVRVEITL